MCRAAPPPAASEPAITAPATDAPAPGPVAIDKKGLPWTPEELQQARDLLNGGKGPSEIARILNRPGPATLAAIKRYGVRGAGPITVPGRPKGRFKAKASPAESPAPSKIVPAAPSAAARKPVVAPDAAPKDADPKQARILATLQAVVAENQPGRQIRVLSHLLTLPRDSFTPADDLFLAEGRATRRALAEIADQLGCESSAIMARWKAMLFADLGQSMADRITPYFDGITRGARNLTDAFNNVKMGFANMLAGMASRMAASGLSRILGSVFGGLFGGGDLLTGAMRGAGLNAIPAYARGTPFSVDGLARLNERGGEILDLPGGTRVIPHDISKRMADQAGGERAPTRALVGVDPRTGNLTAFVDERADMVAGARVERFAENELAGRVSGISQYERERM